MGRHRAGTWGSRSETRMTVTSGGAADQDPTGAEAGQAPHPGTEEAALGPGDIGRRAVGGIGIN